MEEKDIYDLKLHECTSIHHGDIYVTRVPGGWIYEVCDRDIHRPVFVPFDSEFQAFWSEFKAFWNR